MNDSDWGQLIINTERMIVNCRERNVCRVRQLLILLSGLLITKPLKYELIKGGKEQHVIQYILIAHPEVPLIKESLSLTIPNPRAGKKIIYDITDEGTDLSCWQTPHSCTGNFSHSSINCSFSLFSSSNNCWQLPTHTGHIIYFEMIFTLHISVNADWPLAGCSC